MPIPASQPAPATLLLALTTEASAAQAAALAEALLARRLAACVALNPVRSLYRWQGELQRSEEVQLLIKSDPSLLEELTAAVHQLHSYSTPEWIHWLAACSPAYAGWLASSCLLSPDGVASAPPDPPGDGAPAG
jgi:periplasmic divalent cation tolerance protein